MLTYKVMDGRDELTLCGELLGFATSERLSHTHDRAKYEFVSGVPRADGDKNWKCSACRWFEVRIIKLAELDAKRHGCTYVVWTVGKTIVPNEVERSRAHFVNSGYEMVEVLTDRRQGNDFIPVPAQRALAQAADVDVSVEKAYLASVA